jgi:hypothetical protein
MDLAIRRNPVLKGRRISMPKVTKNRYGKALQVFRLETEAHVSIIDLDIQGESQSVRAAIIPLDAENLLRSEFESAGLTRDQAHFATKTLKETEKDRGFLVHIE